MRTAIVVSGWLKLLSGLGLLLALYVLGRRERARMGEDLRAIREQEERAASRGFAPSARPETRGAIYVGIDPDPELAALLEKARHYRMSPEEIEAQRQS